MRWQKQHTIGQAALGSMQADVLGGARTKAWQAWQAWQAGGQAGRRVRGVRMRAERITITNASIRMCTHSCSQGRAGQEDGGRQGGAGGPGQHAG